MTSGKRWVDLDPELRERLGDGRAQNRARAKDDTKRRREARKTGSLAWTPTRRRRAQPERPSGLRAIEDTLASLRRYVEDVDGTGNGG